MKVIPFKVPKTTREAFRLQIDNLPHLYDKLHQHVETQIMLIEKGEGTLIAGDYVGRFTTGDLFLIGSNQPHVFRNDPGYYASKNKQKAQATSLYFDENYAGESFWLLDEMQLVHRFLLNAGLGYRIEGLLRTQVRELIHQLTTSKGIEKLILFFQLLKKLSESTELKPLSVAPTRNILSVAEGKRMNHILEFTLNHSNRKIKIEEIASVANLSSEAFCRYFKLRTQKTYTRFLNELRISNACKMLIEKEKSVQDICYEAGFCNLSHFNRTFKKVTKKTPTSYLT